MQTIPIDAVPVGAHVKHVETPAGRVDTSDWGPVVDAYRPYNYPALARLVFASGRELHAQDAFSATVYGL